MSRGRANRRAAREPRPADGDQACVHKCLWSFTPCAMVSFGGMMYKQFGGYVPMAILTYLLNEGFTFPMGAMALKIYFLDVIGLDGHAAARHALPVRVGWIVKPFVGMLSDVLPLFGFRRSSYLALSCIGGLIAWTTLACWRMPAQATVPFLILAGLSVSVPDVMIDANSAELVQRAPQHASNIQTLNFSAFAVGGLLSCSLSGILLQKCGPRAAFLVLNAGLVCLLVATLMRCLPEKRLPAESRGLDRAWLRKNAGLAGLCTAVSAGASALIVVQVFVHSPLIRVVIACAFVVMAVAGLYFTLRKVSMLLARLAVFVLLHGCLHPSYPDTMFQWMKKAKNGPHFTTVVLGWTDCFGAVGFLIGVLIYTKFLAKWSYRSIFTIAIAATAVPSVFDLALVMRWNLALHIPDIFMAIGDESFQHCVMRLIRIPVAVLTVKACPKGLEGSITSLVLSLGGIGGAMSVLFGSCLLEAFHVDRRHYEHLPEALALRGLVRLVPLIFLPLLIPGGISPSDDIQSQDIEDGDANAEESNDQDADSIPQDGRLTSTELATQPPASQVSEQGTRPGDGKLNPNSSAAFERGASCLSDASTHFGRNVSARSDWGRSASELAASDVESDAAEPGSRPRAMDSRGSLDVRLDSDDKVVMV